jgi:hypothetical protein
MVLDPTCGPYYDDESNRLMNRNGVSYEYWKYHPYPIDETWAYYNDQYFTDTREEVASGWSQGYDVFIEADLLAALFSEESYNIFFVSVTVGMTLLISLFFLVEFKRRKSR